MLVAAIYLYLSLILFVTVLKYVYTHLNSRYNLNYLPRDSLSLFLSQVVSCTHKEVAYFVAEWTATVEQSFLFQIKIIQTIVHHQFCFYYLAQEIILKFHLKFHYYYYYYDDLIIKLLVEHSVIIFKFFISLFSV